MTPRDALLAAAKGRAPDEPVTVAAGWIVAVLASPEAGPSVDLTAANVAELMGRDSDTVTTWCRCGLLPGSYKLRSKEWRIPASALASLQRREGQAP